MVDTKFNGFTIKAIYGFHSCGSSGGGFFCPNLYGHLIALN